MSEYTWKIATIESATLEFEDHGFLTIWLHMAWDGQGQGFGGYGLGRRNEQTDKESAELARWIREIMAVCGVSKWSDVQGKTIMICSSHSKIVGIRNLTQERTFFPGAVPEGVERMVSF